MSFLDNARGEFNPAKENDDWWPLLAGEFPVLAQALAGSDIDVKPADRIPPLTLMVFVRDGRLRFSLSSRDFPRAFYGQVKQPLHVLESIEEALVSGDGEWAAKRSDKR